MNPTFGIGREPCGGWTNNTRSQICNNTHYIKADASIPRYVNITTYTGSNPPISGSTPYPITSSYPPFLTNQFDRPPSGSIQTSSFAVCSKHGFKNVQAIKTWHGMYPFSHVDSTDCNTFLTCSGGEYYYIPRRDVVPDVKYRRLTSELTFTRLHDSSLLEKNDAGVEINKWSREYVTLEPCRMALDVEVNKNSGVRTFHELTIDTGSTNTITCITGCTSSVTNNYWPSTLFHITKETPVSPPGFFWDDKYFMEFLINTNVVCGKLYSEIWGNDCAGLANCLKTPTQVISFFIGDGLPIDTVTTASQADPPPVGGQAWTWSTRTEYHSTGTCTCTLTSHSLDISITLTYATETENIGNSLYDSDSYYGADSHDSATITLHKEIDTSTAYSSNDVYEDIKYLLSKWNLSDDKEYPWREDTKCGVAPIVEYREVRQPVSPNMPIPLTASYYDTNSNYYDGKILGEPLPAGYERYFDFDYSWFISDPADAGMGGYPPSYLPQNATRWTSDLPNAPGAKPSNAWLIFNGGILQGQKWAEIKEFVPSQNLFRPCGEDRNKWATDPDDFLISSSAWSMARPLCGKIKITNATNTSPITCSLYESASGLRTGDYVEVKDCRGNTGANGISQVTVIDSSSFQLNTKNGNGVYTGGGYVENMNSPPYYWNDTRTKGQYILNEWIFDYRDYQESDLARAQYAERPDCVEIPSGEEPLRWILRSDVPNELTGSIPVGGMSPQTIYGLPRAVRIYNASQECLRMKPCSPNVMCISPNNEIFNNGNKAHPFIEGKSLSEPDGFVCDERYGSRWQASVLQRMPDVFFRSDVPDEEITYVEALLELPYTAPVPPAPAIPIHKLNVSDVAYVLPIGLHGEGEDTELVWPQINGRIYAPPYECGNSQGDGNCYQRKPNAEIECPDAEDISQVWTEEFDI